MADTSNLSNYLKDVADAIREKKGTEEQIPAANFDTEILSIETGIDTSDATATENDLQENKTAYSNGEKLIGTLPLRDTYVNISASPTIGKVILEDSISLTNGTVFNLNVLPDFAGKNVLIRYYKSSNVADEVQIGIIPFDDRFIAHYSSDNDYYITTKNNSMIDIYTFRGDDLSKITDSSVFTKTSKNRMGAFGMPAAGTFSLFDVHINSEDGSILYPKYEDSSEQLFISSNVDTKFIMDTNNNVVLSSNNTDVAQTVGLTPEKIVKGNTILGIEGTADVGPITQEEYEECLLLSQQILGLVSV